MHATLLAATRRSDELRRFHWGIFAENNCLYDNFVVATLGHKFKLIRFCAFCCREDKILSRETKFFAKILQDKRRDLSPGRATATYFTRTCRPTGTHGVLCRSDVLHRQVSDCVTTFNQARERGDVF